MSILLKVPESARRFLTFLGTLWGIKSLENRLNLEISGRMTHTLGNCYPKTATIRLNRVLLDPLNAGILREVLCHEAAHAAVFLLHGGRCQPHGAEWKALMKEAKYAPRVKIPGTEVHGQLRNVKRRRYRYTHRCLDCGSIFRSRKTDHRWRCKSCLNLGLGGSLELVERKRI